MSAPPLPWAVRAMPRRAVSRFMGGLGRLKLPRPLLTPVLRVYARTYGADLEEMARPLGDYESFLDFFTRQLRAGARPEPRDALAIAAPADGKVHAAGALDAGTILQAKGIAYSVGDMLGGPSGIDAGTFFTTYLAPGDYHRYHWPFDATLEEVRHIPGDLWPVHPGAVASVPGLFARNERAILLGRTAQGGAFAIAAVGALNVGSIRLTQADLRTNRGTPAGMRVVARPEIGVRRGEEMGWFEFGSALVMVLELAGGGFEALPTGTSLRVGQVIGELARTDPVRRG